MVKRCCRVFLLVAICSGSCKLPALGTGHSGGDSIPDGPSQKVNVAVYPALGYKPETSLLLGAVGLAVFSQPVNPDWRYHRPATLTPYFFVTFRKQFLSYLDFEAYPRNKYYFNGTFKYWNYPDQFYGTGNKTTGVSETYIDRIIRMDVRISRIIKEQFLAGMAFDWGNNYLSNIKQGGFLDTTNVTGKSGGDYLGFGPYLRFDNRDNTLYPTRGFYLETYAVYHPDIGYNDYRFNLYSLDLRGFTTLFSRKNILAFQAYYLTAQGDEIPFYLLPKLGGDQRLRGIEHENRYIDKNAYYLQAEVRRHLFWKFGGVIFAGIGDVSSSMKNFSFNSLKGVIGAGGRFKPLKNEDINIRIDAGKGPKNQWAIYFSLNEAF